MHWISGQMNCPSQIHRWERALRRRGRGAGARRDGRRGFSLIESMIAIVIVGFGVTAMMELLATGTMANASGTELTTAVNLAGNVREISLGLPFYDPQQPTQWSTKESTVAGYDNVLDLDNCSFSPPLDVNRLGMDQYANWRQVVSVESVSEDNLASVRSDTTAEPTARVTVQIMHNGAEVYRMSWLAVAKD